MSSYTSSDYESDHESDHESDYESDHESDSEIEEISRELSEQVTCDEDIVQNILIYFNYAEVSACGLISKTFNKVSKKLYKKKYDEQIKIPGNAILNKILNIKPTFRYQLQSNNQIIADYIKINKYLEKFISNYWPILVHDLDKMETIFFYLARHFYHMKSNVFIINEKEVRDDFDKLRSEISKYLYIVYHEKYTVDQMKLCLAFKGIKGYSKMNRTKVISKLRRPKDELYYF